MASASNKLSQIRKSAKKRGKEFNLTVRYVARLNSQTHCAYTGIPFNQTNRSFERIDNEKGYVIGNVIPVLTSVNTARGDSELSDIILDLCDAELRHKVNPALTMIDHAYYNFKRNQHELLASVPVIDKKITKFNSTIEKVFGYHVDTFRGETEEERYLAKARIYCTNLVHRRMAIEHRARKIENLKEAFKTSVYIQKQKALSKMSYKTCNKLICGMIKFTSMNICQRYNLAQARTLNYGLSKIGG